MASESEQEEEFIKISIYCIMLMILKQITEKLLSVQSAQKQNK